MTNSFRNLLLVLALLSACFLSSLFAADWSYSNQNSWVVEAGKSQSPINIDTKNLKSRKDLGNLNLNYDNTIVSVEDTGHDIHVVITGRAMLNNRPFNPLQVHFHTPSEHTIDNKSYPAEVHFVHLASNGRLGVVGVFFEVGDANPVFETILNNIKKGQVNTINTSAQVRRLLPKQTNQYYHYLGSLTTPPLTENVEWYVLKEPITVSAEQLDTLRKHYNNNNRKVQPTNNRPVLSK